MRLRKILGIHSESESEDMSDFAQNTFKASSTNSIVDGEYTKNQSYKQIFIVYPFDCLLLIRYESISTPLR